MAGGARDGDDDGIITEINVTPLVDVTLVLLIVLMVTAQQIVSKTIPVELPSAPSANNDSESKQLSITIEQGGRILLDTVPVTLTELGARARQAHASHGAETRALIAADARVPHGKVVEVIDALRQAQVVKFAINVRPSELPSTSPSR